ncbi:hypothetical protein V6N11_003261 [Hibiscus sabdariffa]|uniref:Uncharacterized protein n=1 Tax=Hibiscus sabdariffa TaxID=183260 RepID=A0ABR2SCP2_9ROSI
MGNCISPSRANKVKPVNGGEGEMEYTVPTPVKQVHHVLPLTHGEPVCTPPNHHPISLKIIKNGGCQGRSSVKIVVSRQQLEFLLRNVEMFRSVKISIPSSGTFKPGNDRRWRPSLSAITEIVAARETVSAMFFLQYLLLPRCVELQNNLDCSPMPIGSLSVHYIRSSTVLESCVIIRFDCNKIVCLLLGYHARFLCPQLFLSIFSPDIALGRCGGELVLMVEALVRKLEVCLSPLLLVKNPKMLLDFSGFGDTGRINFQAVCYERITCGNVSLFKQTPEADNYFTKDRLCSLISLRCTTKTIDAGDQFSSIRI